MNTYADDATQGHKNTSRSNSFFAALMVLVCIGIGRFAGRSNSGNPKQQPSAVGVYVPSLSVVTLAGVKETITLERAERPTVVYVLSPDCRWCSYNMRNIKSLAASRSGEYRFIGISLRHPDLAHYAEPNKLPFPIFQIDSLDSAPNLLLGQIPETIVIDKHGKVVADWNGAYTGNQLSPALLRQWVPMCSSLTGPLLPWGCSSHYSNYGSLSTHCSFVAQIRCGARPLSAGDICDCTDRKSPLWSYNPMRMLFFVDLELGNTPT